MNACPPSYIWVTRLVAFRSALIIGSLLQGEAAAVEEKPSFSLLDKIRGKRHSSADHPAAIPSTPSGKRHPSFELGQALMPVQPSSCHLTVVLLLCRC